MAKRSSPTSRSRWTEADARRVLDEWQRTGGTLEAFARSRGLVPQRVAWWRNRLRDQRSVVPAEITFAPAGQTQSGELHTARSAKRTCPSY